MFYVDAHVLLAAADSSNTSHRSAHELVTGAEEPGVVVPAVALRRAIELASDGSNGSSDVFIALGQLIEELAALGVQIHPVTGEDLGDVSRGEVEADTGAEISDQLIAAMMRRNGVSRIVTPHPERFQPLVGVERADSLLRDEESTTRRFLGYGRQDISTADVAAVCRVLRSDYLTQGPEVERFETTLREVTGARYAVALANGTAALHLAVAALDIDEGAEGITSTNTFVASANGLVYSGLKPVLGDIDADTFNLSPDEVERRMTERTRVVIPVHFAGQPADMEAIEPLARRAGAAIIEDAAHAIGSRYADGSPVGCGRYADMTIFSFHPVKTVTTAEGGAITTNSEELFQRLSVLRTHGISRDPAMMRAGEAGAADPWYYEMLELGFNYRLSDLHASLGASQLSRLTEFKARRREIVAAYNKRLAGLSLLRTPVEGDGLDSCFHLYVVQMDFGALGKSRAQVMGELRTRHGVGTQVHYIPVHLQPYYRERYGYRAGDLPRAERYYAQALSLPLFPDMDDSEVERVVVAVRDVLGE